MSAEARAWSKRQRLFSRPDKRDVSAGVVLRELADFADAEGCAFPKVATLVEVTGLTARAVQEALRRLEGAGIIVRTGRTAPRNRNVPVYQLRLDAEFAGSVLSDMGAAAAPLAEKGAGDAPQRVQELHPKGAGAAPPIGTTREQEEADASSTRATEQDRKSAFDRAWAAYPEAGRDRSSPRIARRAWDREARKFDPESLVEAVKAFADNPALWGVSGTPCAFHRWLAEGRFENLLPSGEAGQPAARTRFVGPPELRDAFVVAHGEAKAVSYLDRCSWRGVPSALVEGQWAGELAAKGETAAGELRRLLRGCWWAAEIEVTVKPAEPAVVE